MKSNLDPNSPEVIAAIAERISRMTPEELWTFLTYRTPGIEETNITGLFPIQPIPPQIPSDQPEPSAAVTPRKGSRQAKRKSRVPTLS